MPRPSNREAILDAFEQILIARGSGEATLEVIADAAGVSKGGLLYHFASKEDLFAGFGARLLARVDAAIATAPTQPEAVIRWYLDPEPTDSDEAALWRSILAALHGTDAGIDETIRSAFTRYARPLEVLEATLAEQVRLVGDGIFLNSLVGVPPRPELDAIVDDLATRSRRRPG